MAVKNFNEVLKAREAEAAKNAQQRDENEPIALDSTERVKVLSPGRLVFKRFIRNKLAIVGTVILALMFFLAFIGPFFYPYGQTQIFYKYDYLNVKYAMASIRSEYVNYQADPSIEVHYSVANMINSYISQMEKSGELSKDVEDKNHVPYNITKAGEGIYVLTTGDRADVGTYSTMATVATYNAKLGMRLVGEDPGEGFEEAAKAALDDGTLKFTFNGVDYALVDAGIKNTYNVDSIGAGVVTYAGEDLGDEFEAALEENLENGSFTIGDSVYSVVLNEDGTYKITALNNAKTAMVATTYSFDAAETGKVIPDDFRAIALAALTGDGSFTYNGQDYTVSGDEGSYSVLDAAGEPYAAISNFVVRSYSGQDSLSIDFKLAAEEAVAEMVEKGQRTGKFTAPVPQLDENGNNIVDENGEVTGVDTEVTAELSNNAYVLTCAQRTYLIDIYARPSNTHIFGTDADGMDVFARMMYGGRVSLMVGFVVIILETILGVIMGGIAGYFGGWVDNLIMRLVDVFYCIPTYPILIILGAFFDSVRMGSYMRLVWMMAVLGFLGWAGVARLVRGQILSLREQEFMVAAEATGISVSRRIFRHLIPNVMPQLIVNMTMGLGGVIITESTLSFLGLGVKHPLATWGTMINSITSSNENLSRYVYIWVPVGLLICLTVIAFNFVGDGLRDAFDPKMKQ